MRRNRDKQAAPLAPDDAIARIADLRHAYEQGFLTRKEFESCKRGIAARAEWAPDRAL
jgi:hypothetical protein